MPLELTPNFEVERDAAGVVRHLRHIYEPYRIETGFAQADPAALAGAYVRDVAELLALRPDWLASLDRPPEGRLGTGPTRLALADQKAIDGTVLVSYVQTARGLPIWEAGVSVTMLEHPLRVTSCLSSVHLDFELAATQRSAPLLDAKIQPAELLRRLGLAPATRGARVSGVEHRSPRINRTRLLIYRYDEASRFDPEAGASPTSGPGLLTQGPPVLPLPLVPRSIRPGGHYVVLEVLFTLGLPTWGDMNWRAFLEVNTGAVLYLRAFTAAATAFVYRTDPITQSGGTPPTSGAAALDAWRNLVTLPGLTPPAPGSNQALNGQYVKVTDFSAPAAAPPTSAAGSFLFSVPTDDFSAVSAYFHSDSWFRRVAALGFNIATYFDGTTANPGFPVPVDQRGFADAVNARANGNPLGDGLGSFEFGRAASGTTVGIADDARVVAHEFSHALLWDSVHSPNFGFAHSAGDSLAAILNDPGSQAPDRFLTFPWPLLGGATLDRRHDRLVALGWGWGGVNDVGGYNSEQILSTSLFRLYRMTGGDNANASVQLATRTYAAQWIVYLIVKAIGALASSPITPTPTPNVFATGLMTADSSTALFLGIPGGAIQKVVRWSFEQQGLYQPAGAPSPVITPGAPPPVDVYIDDGRAGLYAPYLENFWETTDIWNRLTATPGGGPVDHETPVVGVPNYVYVRVRNRGSQSALNVAVRGFHCAPGSGLVWPDDWVAMTTPEIMVPSIASGATTDVGPFTWTPTTVGHECLLMYASTPGDIANADPASGLPCASGPTPHWRLVPFDNNIAQRNVAPVPGAWRGLAEAFEGRTFRVNNPYDRGVKIELRPDIAEPLRRRGWELHFVSPGGAAFTLGARQSREVRMQLATGGAFEANELGPQDRLIRVHSLIDGIVIGGMSYAIDPRLQAPPRERGPVRVADCDDAAAKLLECLGIAGRRVRGARLKKISVEIDLDSDDD
jgi:hypothetical protein